jgi:hypothetical protein
MTYIYIQLSGGDLIGAFETKSQALRYVDYAGFTEDWKLVDGNNNEVK